MNRRTGTKLQRAAIVLSACLLQPLLAHAQLPTEEVEFLHDFYSMTNGDDWDNNSGWMGSPGTECSWHGVTCDNSGEHVVELSLPTNNLTGELPGSLNKLSQLRVFSVRDNYDLSRPGSGIQGPIPNLDGLSSLAVFNVSRNKFTGSIPVLQGLGNLQTFDVSLNELSGTIPDLQGLDNLKEFSVASNQLEGNIPELQELENLLTFHAYRNNLTGVIPELQGLENLQSFQVAENKLTGTIPPLRSEERRVGKECRTKMWEGECKE